MVTAARTSPPAPAKATLVRATRAVPAWSFAACAFATRLVAAIDTKSKKNGALSEINEAGPRAASCVVLTRPTKAASMSDIRVGAA